MVAYFLALLAKPTATTLPAALLLLSYWPLRRLFAGDRTGRGSKVHSGTISSADAAEEGMRATIPLEARKGRASYLGPRSVGHQDPGATSSSLLLRAAANRFGA